MQRKNLFICIVISTKKIELIEAFLKEKTSIVPLHIKDVNVEGNKTYSPPKQDKDDENEYMQSHDKQTNLKGDSDGTRIINCQGAKDVDSQET